MRYITRLLNKANIILLLGLFGLANYSTGQTLTASIATFDVANLSNSSEHLANSWLTEPLPLSLYSEQEKLHQQALNERLVDAVMTYSPSTQKSEWQNIDFEDITPYTWKWIDLELVHKDSSISKVSLRRPNWWILSVGADTVGDKVYINLPEMGIDGWASLRAIRANYLDTRFWNENRQGDYVSRPITAKFEHQTKSFYNLYFENITEPLGVTSTHPIWSLDRNTWVKVEDLKVGEALKTQNGKVVLKSKDLIEQPQTVYNLEIYRDHNYSVSADKVLVHNTGCDDLPDGVLYRIVKKDKKGRTYGVNSPDMPTLADFNPRTGNINAGSLDDLVPRHGINEIQANPLRGLSNEDLIRFRIDDPISVNRTNITGGHHRINEIMNRVKNGTMSPDTPITILFHD